MRKSIPLFVLFLLYTLTLNAATNISGQVRNNVTWTKSGSPYMIDAGVEIAPNVTVTIDPGTELILAGNLDIYGAIHLIGTSNDIIRFRSQDGNDKKLSFMTGNLPDTLKAQYCSFEHINLRAGGVNLAFDNCSFMNANSLFGSQTPASTVCITNCNITNTEINMGPSKTFFADKNVVVNGWFKTQYVNNVIITNNVISNGPYGIWCYYVNTPVFQNNIIFNTTQFGIDLVGGWLDTDNPISGNIITHNQDIGIRVRNSDAMLSGNSIYDNTTGIYYASSSQQATFENNCIYNNGENFRYNSAGSYAIGTNWWGTPDSTTIEGTIFDYEDDFKIGKISFMPVLQQAYTSCKTYIPTGIPDMAETNSISVSPNPCSNVINIKAAQGDNIRTIQLFDITGKEIYFSAFKNTNNVS
ncbi:MAG: right-handed parallel beta-helix repeat-containing protein, partial [Chitinophagaceae bacterium]|nr:right-handed parallel beta-helix repeat-containing protein [Chitinophagaceae bacterium]